jgi:hypothetical protein
MRRKDPIRSVLALYQSATGFAGPRLEETVAPISGSAVMRASPPALFKASQSCFFLGHDFSRAAKRPKKRSGFSGCGKIHSGGQFKRFVTGHDFTAC